MPESVTMNLVCLHVFLHVGLLGKGSSADDALERFLSCVTVGRKQWEVRSVFFDGCSVSCWPVTHLLMCCWRSKFLEKILSQKLHFSFGPFPFSCSAEWNSGGNEHLSHDHQKVPIRGQFNQLISVVCSLPSRTCRSVWAFFAAPWSFGDDDLFKVAKLCQVGGDAADLCFGALLPGAVDRRRGERLALHTLTGHLRETNGLSALSSAAFYSNECHN